MTNLILATDSYKQSHFKQYPPEAKRISAYVEARHNKFSEKVLFFGLQAFLKEYLCKPISGADIEEAKEVCAAHGAPFNEDGWRTILHEYDGYLPIEITALREGTLVPSGVPLVQVQNTDTRMPWLSTWIETMLLRGIWYPSTVATQSFLCKEVIYEGLKATSDDTDGQIPFKLHDFGARGVSSGESAALGGLAHLINFSGTDTMEAILAARKYYGEDMAGFSIPAAEHSTMTSWGPNREEDAYANMIEQFGGEGKLVAVVSDSYDLDNAVENIWGNNLKDKVQQSGGTLVVRPDSGDPVSTPIRVIEKLWDAYGGTTNSKGFRVLDPAVRVIQGDGMTIDSIRRLVERLVVEKWSIDNIAFGMGGGLLQLVNRDTMRFAMKANAMQIEGGEWQDVAKKPATDPTKASKAGRQAVVIRNGDFAAVRADQVQKEANLLKPVFRDGELLDEMTLADVKANAWS